MKRLWVIIDLDARLMCLLFALLLPRQGRGFSSLKISPACLSSLYPCKGDTPDYISIVGPDQ